MAKTRKKNSIVSAISMVTAALRLESIPNPTKEQQQEIHDAKVAAANCIDNSNFVALGENADKMIETAIQAEEDFEEAEADQQEAELDEVDQN